MVLPSIAGIMLPLLFRLVFFPAAAAPRPADTVKVEPEDSFPSVAGFDVWTKTLTAGIFVIEQAKDTSYSAFQPNPAADRGVFDCV